ncbi:MlaD family protein [Thermoleophilum album]|uniref:Virulence factor Mce family protein n=1 Tax=Thermoleophilum album TaxID=29539 RepID=A0A1H6FML4_THEAL|nr:MlaD family protein [Thermoleophilum album]SEH12151.1 virulence factor Mce family protein [Thermoleophilum album]
MRRRRGAAALTGSPVLVGAVTVLVTVIAVFLAYNANRGLPFVPTYDLKVRLPDAANLVRGNDVRIGGTRVGVISAIHARRDDRGRTYAELTLKLDKTIEPLPADSSVLVRPRSTLGLKYLEITPGSSSRPLRAGSTLSLAAARPRPVELDELFNTFDARTRRGQQRALQGFGNGLAGRGADLNEAIARFPRLLSDLEAVMANLSDPATRLDRFFPALERAAREVAPVADQQAALFVNLDITFAALARVARPYFQETISRSVPALEVATREFPKQRPFLRNSAGLFADLRPGIAALARSAPTLADALAAGSRSLPRTPPLNRRAADVFDTLAEFAADPLVPRGLGQLTRLARALRPALAFLAPVQTTCNYVTLWFRNVSNHLSEGNATGTWQRFVVIAPPLGENSEAGPSNGPANGNTPTLHLHSNPYPNTASPGQPRECEAANEPYLPGTVVGNVPGNQGIRTEGQR